MNNVETIKKHLGIDNTVSKKTYISFSRFLKEHSAFGGYNYNIKHGILTRSNVSRLSELLLYSFLWSSTKEGHDYWSLLNCKWERENK